MPRRSSPEIDPLSGVQAVRLVVEILEHLAKEEVAGVTEIATVLGSTKGRVHRHLRTLVNMGYAAQQEGGERYVAGPRLIVLAQMLSAENSLTSVARPVMRKLRDAFGHAVTLAGVTGGSASMIDCFVSRGLVNIGITTGHELPLHANAVGKTVLAFGDAAVQAMIEDIPLERLTEHTITDRATLKADIQRVREQGWADAPEEYIIGINSLAAPIFDHGNRLVATIGLVNSVQFLGRRPTVEVVSRLTAAAAEVTRHLSLLRSGAQAPGKAG